MSILSTRRAYPQPPVECSIPESHKDKILKDLLKNKPSGPTDDTKIYAAESGTYRERLYHGYRYDTFFRLGVRSEEDLWEALCDVMYPEVNPEDLTRNQRGAITRSRNRVWPSIKNSIMDTRVIGSRGIYEVYDYSSFFTISGGTLGYVYADDLKTAQLLAKTLFGFMTDEKSVRVKYTEWGNRELVNMLNVGVIGRIAQECDDMHQRVKTLEKKIKSATCQIDLLTSIVDYD